jgi:membrane-bound lytic murein transglycosylase D
VAHYLSYFTGPARDRMAQWLDRGTSFRGLIRDRLAREGLPLEFEYLPLIESGYSSTAVSRAGAVGMWQLIPETAQDLGLVMNRFVDERRDPVRATDAAVRHIRGLTRRFGSPLLAAAAYNGGPGRLGRGLERLQFDGDVGLTDRAFFQLADRRLLAQETRDYVPQLLAAAAIGRDPERYGFESRPLASPAHDSVRVGRMVSLDGAAGAIGLDRSALFSLNPQFVRGVTPPGAASWIRVPQGLGESLARRLPEIPRVSLLALPSPRPAAGARVRVRRGDTVEAIAERHGVAVDQLRRVNALPSWFRLRPGQVLRLPAP